MAMTRADKKARTRSALLAAAAKVFAAKGYHGAAVDDVAIEAGVTKGAVYAHFRTKEALFLALVLEQGLANLAEVEAAFDATVDSPTRRRAGLLDRAVAAVASREWSMVGFEFLLHAARDPVLRRQVRDFYDRAREVDAAMTARAWREAGVDPAIAPQDFARITNGLILQLSLEQILNPKADMRDTVKRTLSFLTRAASQSKRRS